MEKQRYRFIGKAIFFPEKGILAIGDLHLGYEHQLIKSGILTPKTQMKNLIKNLESIFNKITKNNKENLKKIVFLGDIKHSFGFENQEKFDFRELFDFLREYFQEENIIFIKGNHDTIDYSFQCKIKDFYVKENIAFIHGHKSFPEIYDRKIKTIVMGHIHPSVIFSDKDTSKKEQYKAFLIGKYKKKEVIILPSFIGISIGSPINDYEDYGYEDGFSIIPKKSILNFKVYVIGKDKTYEFGKVRSL